MLIDRLPVSRQSACSLWIINSTIDNHYYFPPAPQLRLQP